MNEERNNHLEENLSTEHEIRVDKTNIMRKQGIEPWPYKRDVKNTAKQVLGEFSENSDKEYSIAGRVVALRWHGKTAFAQILDRTDKIQIYIRLDILGEEKFKQLQHLLDLGDIVWVQGSTFMTKTGEVTVKANDLVIISKCLHHLL